MTLQEMIDYLLSTKCYENETRNSLFYETRMMVTEKTIPIKELVERFIDVDREYNGEPWNLRQILANINIILPIGDRKEILK